MVFFHLPKILSSKLLFLVILFSSLALFAQNETSKWYFGNNAGIDFMTSPPSSILGGQLSTAEGCSGIADASGNLLFYTDGITVWNSTNAIMANGTGLDGDPSSTQSAVVVKQPGNSNIYYIFTMACCNSPVGLKYSTVDMNLSGGLGSVTVVNATLAGVSSERLTSVKHCNGIDTWVLSQDGVNGDFRAHLVTSAGVNPVPVISAIGSNAATGPAYVGYMKFSPNGRKLGLAAANDPSVGFELYDFDASTGIVSNRLLLVQNAWSYGCEFSPDGTKFFGALWGGGNLYQWDLCAGSPTAIVNSVYTGTTNNGGALQLAKDGKIYMTRSGFQVMGDINNPNVMGVGMNYVDNGQSIAPNTNQYGLPNFITSGLKQPPPPFTHTVNCLSASFTAPQVFQNYTVNACVASGYSLTGMMWNFGDPASGAANTSTLTNPTHAFSGLGTYSAKLILYYSCGGGTDTIAQNVVVNQPCVNVITAGISCSVAGSATVNATAGIGPYSYFWLPSGPSTSVITNLYPGTYSVSVYDFGNNTTYTAPVTITTSAVFTGTLAATSTVSCFGSTTGTAAIFTSGGTGSQNYYWFNGLTTVNTSSLNNLGAGLYTVTVVDAVSSCAVTKTFTITQPTSNTLSIIASTLTACVGSNITFTANNTGGTPGYSYTWTAGPQNAVNMVTQLSGGNYTYTVTSSDTNNCQASQTIQVNFVSIPSPSITANYTALCTGQNLALNGTGGNAYSWTGPNGSSGVTQNLTINNIALAGSGVYTLVVTVGPCTASITQSITVHPLPTPTFTAPIICENHNLQLNASPGGGVSFVWTGPLNFSSPQQNPVIPLVVTSNSGMYNLTVTDINMCSASVSNSVTILQNPFIQAGGNTVCFGTPAVLNASGAISYVWSGPNGFTSNLANAVVPAANSVSQEIYTVVGTALNTCTASAVAYLNTIALPLPSLTVTPRACVNSTVTLQASGGNSYKWTGPYNFSANTQNVSFVAHNINFAGMYTVTAINSLGCAASAKSPLQLDPLPQGELISSADNFCIPFCSDFSFDLKTTAPLTNLTWQINAQSYNTPGFRYCFADMGSYVINAAFSDNIGCTNTSSFAINAFPLPKADFEFFPSSPVEGLDAVNFESTSVGSNLTTWNWYFVNNDGYKIVAKNPSYVFENAGIYPVAMVVKNTWGCADTIVKTIKVESDFGVFVPNAFTPNQDGNNELFQAKGIGIVKYSLIVYSRWGQKVFETTDFTKGWDGTFKGTECKSDVYVWKVFAANASGKEKNLSGYVTLYR